MPGFLLPLGTQFDDDNGDPLNGGKLYAYAAGTSTPLAIYQDQGLITPHANPAILSAAGRLIAYVQDGIAYKFTLKDSTDVPITGYPLDNISVPQILAAAAAAEVPTGAVMPYGGSAAPTGYLLADGTAVSRSTYATLFAAIGTAFGVGNGSTTFNLPDMRGRFALGKAAAGTGSTLGGTGGTIDHVHTGPSHTHTIAAHSHTIAHTHTVPHSGWATQNNTPPLAGILQAGGSGAGSEASATQANATNTTGASSAANSGTTALTSDAGGTGNTGSANPPFTALNFIVKT